jgi:hypothetical protein
MILWWVSWEEWESGECYSTRKERVLVNAATAQRAVQIVLEEELPLWVGDTHFDKPIAYPFVTPTSDKEGIVR